MWKTKLDCLPRCNLYRKFETIGCVDSNGMLTYSSFFPNSKFGFNRRHLLVTTIWVGKIDQLHLSDLVIKKAFERNSSDKLLAARLKLY